MSDIREIKSPSKMKFTVVNKKRPDPKMLRDLARGETIFFRDAPHMVVHLSLYQHIKDRKDFSVIDGVLANAFAVINLATGRVYAPNSEELVEPAIMINIKADVEYI